MTGDEIERLKTAVPPGLDATWWANRVRWLAHAIGMPEVNAVDSYILRAMAEASGQGGPPPPDAGHMTVGEYERLIARLGGVILAMTEAGAVEPDPPRLGAHDACVMMRCVGAYPDLARVPAAARASSPPAPPPPGDRGDCGEGPGGGGEAAGWEDRLAADPAVSQVSPVVKGTAYTAQQVVGLVVDGWTWSDILRTHPGLTEADIRACLAFAVERGDGCGPGPGGAC